MKEDTNEIDLFEEAKKLGFIDEDGNWIKEDNNA